VITIEHTHADGTLLHGTARGDGTGAVIKPLRDGWRFSRNIGTDGAWYLPHSRDRRADRSVIDRLAAALRNAGYEVEVTIDDAPRAAADIEADRAERVAGRVDRYGELADARHTSGGARLAHVQQRRSHLAPGQPVISQRYANFLQRLNRTEGSARAEIATGDHWQGRAEAAASTQSYRHDPRVITRRIERLEADQRRWQRARDDAPPATVPAPTTWLAPTPRSPSSARRSTTGVSSWPNWMPPATTGRGRGNTSGSVTRSASWAPGTRCCGSTRSRSPSHP